MRVSYRSEPEQRIIPHVRLSSTFELPTRALHKSALGSLCQVAQISVHILPTNRRPRPDLGPTHA